MGSIEDSRVGSAVPSIEGAELGESSSLTEGERVGSSVDNAEGAIVSTVDGETLSVGCSVGSTLCSPEELAVGLSVASSVGTAV